MKWAINKECRWSLEGEKVNKLISLLESLKAQFPLYFNPKVPVGLFTLSTTR